MGRSAADGVVDEHGRVFDASSPNRQGVYPGLYITDGAIVPTALGVNPSLTISALALCCADAIWRDLTAAAGARPRSVQAAPVEGGQAAPPAGVTTPGGR